MEYTEDQIIAIKHFLKNLLDTIGAYRSKRAEIDNNFADIMYIDNFEIEGENIVVKGPERRSHCSACRENIYLHVPIDHLFQPEDEWRLEVLNENKRD